MSLRPYGTFAAVTILVLAILVGMWSLTGGGILVNGSQDATTAVCQAELGDEWEAAGVAAHDDWTHYHVKCERSTGLLRSETQWVTVRAAELPDADGKPVLI